MSKRLIETSACALLALSLPAAAQATWEVEAKLLAPDGVDNAAFGWSVAVSGSTVVVGAPEHLDRGGAFVFVRRHGGWRHEATLLPRGLPSFGRFGHSVALAEGLAIVGAPSEPPGSGDIGAAYVFERQPDGQWLERERIVSTLSGSNDSLSLSLALHGDTALLTGKTSFVPPGRIFQNGAAGFLESDAIGMTDPGWVSSSALTEAFALLGTPWDWPMPFEHAGAVHAFERLPGGAFSPQVTIEPADTHSGQKFGSSVALVGSTAFIGAEGDDEDGLGAGAAYAFTRQANGTWIQDQKIHPAGGAGAYWSFGVSVAASLDHLAVGAPHRFAALPEAGSEHVFQPDGSGWVETARLVSARAPHGDHFGFSVALQRDTLVAGAPEDAENGPLAGAAHVSRRRP